MLKMIIYFHHVEYCGNASFPMQLNSNGLTERSCRMAQPWAMVLFNSILHSLMCQTASLCDFKIQTHGCTLEVQTQFSIEI